GKQLKITRSADTVWINGIRIGGKEIVSTENETVYTVKSSLSATNPTDDLQSTSLEITVWDASKWSTAEPKGRPATALVTLFRSQLDYANNSPAYPSIATVQGKAVFRHITAGTYYIAVNADGLSN